MPAFRVTEPSAARHNTSRNVAPFGLGCVALAVQYPQADVYRIGIPGSHIICARIYHYFFLYHGHSLDATNDKFVAAAQKTWWHGRSLIICSCLPYSSDRIASEINIRIRKSLSIPVQHGNGKRSCLLTGKYQLYLCRSSLAVSNFESHRDLGNQHVRIVGTPGYPGREFIASVSKAIQFHELRTPLARIGRTLVHN